MVMSSAPQVLRQAEALKAIVTDSGKSISELWVSRQRLEDLYKKLLLMDLEYALDKKVEQDLWNHAFKNQINILQTQAKDKQNPKRGEVQASLNLFLETASGSYGQFMQLICTTFKLDLPFRRKSAAFGIIKEKCPLRGKITPPKKSSCLYICQHCLVHLGDIARYRQQVDQAQTYYLHAANLVPQNGHPYNQLAILEAARGNKLSTVFYYIRSLAVRSPFPVAATNLEKFYAKLVKDLTETRSKLSMSEVVSAFLQFNALIHLSTDFQKATVLRDKLLASLPAHITSQSFQAIILVHFVAITIFTLHHIQEGSPGGSTRSSPALKQNSVSRDEEKSFEIVFSFLVSLLDVLLQFTPKQGTKAKDFCTLPAVRVILDWMSLNRDYFYNNIIATSGVWGQLSKLLNSIQPSPEETSTDLTKFEELPLMEDGELRCFQPIEKAHNVYSFSRLPSDGLAMHVETQLRCRRLVLHGQRIAEEFANLNVLTCQTKNGKLQFSAPNAQNKGVDPGGEKKSSRQNVAIQAIIQKQGSKKGTDQAPEPRNMLSRQGSNGEGKSASASQLSQTSTKYILGVPTSEPQFMKHSGGNRMGQGNVSRFPTSGVAQNPPFMAGATGPSPQRPSSVAGNSQQVGFNMRGPAPGIQPRMPQGGSQGHAVGGQGHVGGGQGHASGSQGLAGGSQGQTGGNQGLAAAGQSHTSPQNNHVQRPPAPYMMQPPFPQADRYHMQPNKFPPPPNMMTDGQQASMATTAAAQQLRAAMMRQPLNPAAFANLSSSQQQILSALKLATQLSQQQQQQQGMMGASQQHPITTSMQQEPTAALMGPGSFPPAPGTERAQTSPKMPQQPMNYQGSQGQAFPTYSGQSNVGYEHQRGPAAAPMTPVSYPGNMIGGFGKDEKHMKDPRAYVAGISQLTIQPPKPSITDMRLNSSFQGHAEGTPKPDMSEEKEAEMDLKPPDRVAVVQPGVYSLFSGTSWSVPLSAGNDSSKSHGSSPFSSATSSIRNSPEHPMEMPQAPNQNPSPSAFDLGLRFGVQHHWGGANQTAAMSAPPSIDRQHPPQGSYLSSSIQSIWSSPGPSPLEKLLEQQRHQRQNEPH